MDIIRPADAGFETELAGFQTAHSHRPDAVVPATSVDDVRAAVTLAGERGWPVAVRSSGHGSAAAVDRGLLITTKRLDGVRIDPSTRTARIEAGVPWGAVVTAAAEHGLAPLSGSSPGVGAAGYVLGGGLGVLARRYGYAADHVRSIDVVTADAMAHHVTAGSDPDLFWALRGGGTGFGVVTALEIELVPVTTIHGGGLYFDASLDVLRAWADWTKDLPEELTSSIGMLPYPDADWAPAPLRGKYVAHVRIAFDGPTATGERLVAPLRELGPRLIDTVADMPFTEAETIFRDPPAPHAYRGANAMLGELDDVLLRAVVELGGPDAPLPSVIQINHLGGALSRPPAVPNAVGHRDAAYLMRVVGGAEDADAVAAAQDAILAAAAPWTLGRNPNFVFGFVGTPEQVRSNHDPEAADRLAALRAERDPADRFSG
ncbi:FAD-binding oxidoreductase [Pseudonocardia sp. GCM10023141]|uniref:FAD-binding oxidoreductase n=1 Tax=Pseudonocardia sp. GCM10023141 TaxID=3252653 RepID=UPI00360F2B72